MQLNKILINTASSALKEQKKDGSMPAGFNGPHQHPETPIRNTCHWAIVFLKVFEITKDKKFKKASEQCMQYILGEKEKFKYNLPHRDFEGKDKCNGLIGPAWTMEALIFTGHEDLASEIFLLHSFDEEKGLWHRREVDGEVLGIDWTFNHQLWFASVGSMLNKKKYPQVHKQISVFIEKLDENFGIWEEGLISHKVISKSSGLKRFKTFFSRYKNKSKEKDFERYREIGYHQFNLYAFGILKETYPNVSFWKSEKFKKALKFLEREKFEKSLEENKYGFDYNVAGIEVAFVFKVFKKNSQDLQKYWLEKQFRRNYDFEKNTLSKNTLDGITLTARIYEATRLDSLDLKVTEKEPFVSVVIPVYNDPKRIEICIKKLLEQTYPRNKYEIIVVDNNSTDETAEIVKKYPVKLFFEKEIQSSYAARNKGLEKAKGEIVAFTDSDCQPTSSWIENGVKGIWERKADLLAGKVSFIFKDKNNPYEIYDSLFGINQKRKVEGGTAATANLFVRQNVFHKVGSFMSNMKSGGDSEFTFRATSKSFKLFYEEKAEVLHPTRGKEELLKKHLRIGYGRVPTWREKGKSFFLIILILFKDFLPPLNFSVGSLKMYMINWRCFIYQNIGTLLYLKDRLFFRKKQ